MTRAARKTTHKPPPAPTRVVFDTFRSLGAWERSNLEHAEPSCFNGIAAVRKWRVTFELLDEPRDEVCARLQRLWEECDNHHNWAALESEAASIGYTLVGRPGSRRSKP